MQNSYELQGEINILDALQAYNEKKRIARRRGFPLASLVIETDVDVDRETMLDALPDKALKEACRDRGIQVGPTVRDYEMRDEFLEHADKIRAAFRRGDFWELEVCLTRLQDGLDLPRLRIARPTQERLDLPKGIRPHG